MTDEKYTTERLNKSIMQAFYDLNSKIIDQDLQYSDERLQQVNKFINESDINTYLQSKMYVNKFANKTKKSLSSEREHWTIGLDLIADYLLFPKYRNEDHEVSWNQLDGTLTNNYGATNHRVYDDNKKVIAENYYAKTDGYPALSKNAKNKMGNNISLDELRENSQNDEMSEDEFLRLKLEGEYNKRLQNQMEVSELDKVKYPEVKNIMDSAAYIHKKLGHGKSANVKEKLRKRIANEYYGKIRKVGFQTVKDYIALISELHKSVNHEKFIELKSELIPAEVYNKEFTDIFTLILPSNIETSESEFINYNFTGFPSNYTEKKYNYKLKMLHNDLKYEAKYIRERLRSPILFKKICKNSSPTDYDYSKFSFSDPKHVYSLFKLYKELLNSNMYDIVLLIDEINEYIESCNWTIVEKDIIEMFKDGMPVRQIIGRLEDIYKFEHNKARRMIKGISKRISEYYMQYRDEFLMDKYDIKGKKCSKCGIIKLGCKRNFSPDKRNSDGLRSICNECRNNYTKKREKF